MPIVINHKGNFSKTWRFLEKIKSKKFFDKLNKYGKALDIITSINYVVIIPLPFACLFFYVVPVLEEQ